MQQPNVKERYRHRSTFDPDEVDRITTEFDDCGLIYRVNRLWYADSEEPETKLSLVTIGEELEPKHMNAIGLLELSALPVNGTELDADLNEWALLHPESTSE